MSKKQPVGWNQWNQFMNYAGGKAARRLHAMSAAEMRQWIEDVQPTGDMGRLANRLLRKAEARERRSNPGGTE